MLNDRHAADLDLRDVLLLLAIFALIAGGAIGLVWIVVSIVLRLVRP
jgi:hypothetical protein